MNRATRTLARVAVHAAHVVSTAVGDDVVSKRVRRATLRALGARFGRRAFLHGGGYVSQPWHLSLGDGVFVNRNCYFDLEAAVTIERGATIGHGVSFVTTVHEIGPSSHRAGAHGSRAICVGEGAWVGANATLLPGVRIGRGAVVAAGALVARDVEADTLVAGVPARPVRRLEEEAVITPAPPVPSSAVLSATPSAAEVLR